VRLDILADPYLWYDKREGFIGPFALYNTQRLTGGTPAPVGMAPKQATFRYVKGLTARVQLGRFRLVVLCGIST
jgi:hypothetical protein